MSNKTIIIIEKSNLQYKNDVIITIKANRMVEVLLLDNDRQSIKEITPVVDESYTEDLEAIVKNKP